MPGNLVQIPWALSATGLSYHLHGIGCLHLTGRVIAAIYVGQITNWSDPLIARANPGLRLPDLPVTFVRRSDGSVLATSGVYRIVEPPRLLAFSWAWEDESGTRGHETEVVVNFEAAPGGTRLVLVQRRFASKQARDNHTNGWSASFDRLTRVAG